MAKTSIYLPDDLADQVRAHGIPISEVAQAALRQAVREAEIKEHVMTDMQAVAERLNATRAQAAADDRATRQKARSYGAKWARTTASAEELECVATDDGQDPEFLTPVSLVTFIVSEHGREFRETGGHGMPGPSGVPTRPGEPYWQDFQAGAREVWEAVQPLLIEIGDHGETLPAGSGGSSQMVSPAYRLWLEREPAPDAPLAEHDRWMAEEPEEFL